MGGGEGEEEGVLRSSEVGSGRVTVARCVQERGKGGMLTAEHVMGTTLLSPVIYNIQINKL